MECSDVYVDNMDDFSWRLHGSDAMDTISDDKERMINMAFCYIRTNNCSGILDLISQGFDINDLNFPIRDVFINGHIDIIKLFVDLGTPIEKYYCYAHDAAFYGHFELMKYFISLFPRNDETIPLFNHALITAIMGHKLNIARLLLETVADIHYQADEALVTACCYNYFEIAKLLIEHGANINAQYFGATKCSTALVRAIICRNLQLVQLLVEMGADYDNNIVILLNGEIDILKYFMPIFPINSETSVFYNENFISSVKASNTDIVRLLVETIVDIHYANDYAVVIACKNDDYDMAKLLIGYGANVNAQGNRPMIEAVLHRNKELTQLLLDNGANANQQNIIDYVEDNELNDISDIIEYAWSLH